MTAEPSDRTQNEGAPVVHGGASPGDLSSPLDLEAVRRREPEALGALFDRYFDRIYAVVHRMLGDRTAAEDAVQEVFLKIYGGAPTLDPARDPGPWLVTIAANVCRDRWRSGSDRLARASSSIEASPGLAERLDGGVSNPERDLIASERGRRVRDAVARLKPEFREVIVLREYDGLGYDRIAAMLGIKEAAVRKRFSRALDELGKHLNEVEL